MCSRPTGVHVHVHWLDAATLVGVGGLWLAVFIWQLARGPWLRETGSRRREIDMPKGPATHDCLLRPRDRDLSVRAIVWFAVGMVIWVWCSTFLLADYGSFSGI